jgi:hypothetical protein
MARRLNWGFRLHEGFLLLLLACFIVLALQVVYGQPQPCAVSGWVMYDTGQPCYDSGDCYCNITNKSGAFVGSARTNASGYYSDTVNVYSYADNLTANCTATDYISWNGSNQNNCTNGKASINVTIWTPEFSGVGEVPGFLVPVLISGGLCVAFIRMENNS